MTELYQNCAVLMVSASETFAKKLSALLTKEGLHHSIWAESIGRAKLLLMERNIDFLILDAPIPGEDVGAFAVELAKNKGTDYGIIMLAGAEIYEQNLYQTERMGIVSFKKPLDPRLLLQTVRLLVSMRSKIKKLETKADSLAQKMEEDRIINRAKMLLIEQLRMTEAQAHRYIEKKAMDDCIKKFEVAKGIVRYYEGV